jgi:pyruvate formate lyase activating enzyme
LKKRKGLLDGVVICGGEPTIYKELPAFAKKIKKLGYLVKLDTNGSNPKMLKTLIGKKLIDYVAMDIKAPLGVKIKNSELRIQNYDAATGTKVNLNKIKKSIEIIKNSRIDYEFRTTIIPKLHNQKDIVEIAKQLKGAKTYVLQQFKPEKTIDSKYKKYKPFSQKQITLLQKECQKYIRTELRNI